MFSTNLLTSSADTLVRKFEKYNAELVLRRQLLEKLSQSVSQEDLQDWEAKRQRFEEVRITHPEEADTMFGAELTQGVLHTHWVCMSTMAQTI